MPNTTATILRDNHLDFLETPRVVGKGRNIVSVGQVAASISHTHLSVVQHVYSYHKGGPVEKY